ncbi:hypothetical protein ACJMK2_040911 [Sinanodonta woodiana]|uniref:Receptor for retinol uptake STRA6 n=1 Tax=Sinanodonta woodiana TaxID=1069815 RepID=A0ABD3W2G9_SINWO
MALSDICLSLYREVQVNSGFYLYTKNIHWFLIFAVPFAFAWCFLERRKSFKKNILGGRPALYSVINLLDGGIRDRWGTSFILGAMTTLIYILTFGELVASNLPIWSRVLMVYVQALEATFLALPFFVCLTTRFRLLGGVIGLCYAIGWAVFSLYNVAVPLKCFVEVREIVSGLGENSDISEYKAIIDVGLTISILQELPGQVCFICIVGKFITRIYYCIKTGEYVRQNENEISVTNCKLYVKYLMAPDHTKTTQTTREKYLKRFFHKLPGFTYSIPIFSIAFMMAILLYQIILLELLLVDILRKRLHRFPDYLSQVLQGCNVASSIVTGIYCLSVIYSLLMNYKRHMLMLYKGERRFLPQGIEKEKPEAHLVRSTQYMGYQILGMISGTAICFICIFVPLSILCIVFKLVEELHAVPQLLEQFEVLVYPVTALIILRVQTFIVGKFLLQERLNPTDPHRPLAIDNRKAHDLFKFFMLFVNLSIGILVFLMRLINNIFLGIFLIPRMDRSLFPMGFEKNDQCYMSYVGMLMVDFTHNNPVMRMFCSLLLKTAAEKHDQRRIVHITAQNALYGEMGMLSFPRQYQGQSRARTKWLLAYTLIKNPSIAGTRKHALPEIVLMEASDAGVNVLDRVQHSIISTLFAYIGMAIVLMTIVFIYFGFETIFKKISNLDWLAIFESLWKNLLL